jgi:hypothetical protein
VRKIFVHQRDEVPEYKYSHAAPCVQKDVVDIFIIIIIIIIFVVPFMRGIYSFSLSRTVMPGLLLGMVLAVCTC